MIKKPIDAEPVTIPTDIVLFLSEKYFPTAATGTETAVPPSAVPITTSGTTDTQSFNYTLDPTWVEANCEVVAFIYKEGPDYEVMQANIENVCS